MRLLPVYRRKEIIIHTEIDDDVYDEQSRYRWGLSGGYVRRTEVIDGERVIISLAREVVGNENIPLGMLVDHKDRNKLNNQRSNLRVVTRAQNRQNLASHRTHRGRTPTSGFRGVSYSEKYGMWKATVGKIFLGHFVTAEAANEAASRKRREVMPFSVEEELEALE